MSALAKRAGTMHCMALRFDKGEFRAPVKTDAGFLRADAYLTRAGVFLYRDADGKERRELRHPDEVFAPESLESLALAPLTLDHPEGLVTAQNAKALAVGSVGDSPSQEGRFVRSTAMVTDAAAVAAVEAGTHRETSCGYTCDLDETPGEYEGEPYDVAQKNIKYNHVALVPKGRAGPDVRLRLDGESNVSVQMEQQAQCSAEGEKRMATQKVRLTGATRNDAVTISVEEGDVQALLGLNEKLQAAIAEAEAAKAEAEKAATDADEKAKAAEEEAKAAKADAEAQKGRADGLDAELKKHTDPAAFAARVAARVALESQARPILGAEVKLDAMDDAAVRAAVLAKLDPALKLDGRSPDYVAARYDVAVELAAKSAGALGDLRKAAGRADTAGVNPVEAARARMVARIDGKDAKDSK